MKLSLELELSLRADRGFRFVPTLGRFTEQRIPAVPTHGLKKPNHHGTRYSLMAFTMSDSQQVTVTIAPVDKKGNPATLDGAPVWSTDNTDVLALTPAADGLSCLVAAVGPLGTGTVTVKGDADLGTGTAPIIGTLEVTITGGTATTITLTPGTPTEQ